MAWYYAMGGQRRGPVSDEEFGDLVRRGVVAPDSLVWTAGMADWRRLSEVAPELPPPIPARTDALGGAAGPALTGTAANFGRAVAEAGAAAPEGRAEERPAELAPARKSRRVVMIPHQLPVAWVTIANDIVLNDPVSDYGEI